LLDDVKARLAPDELIFLLCRSGVGLRDAAEFWVERGFRNSFKVLEGFAGDKNSVSQSVVAGWKAHGSPWVH